MKTVKEMALEYAHKTQIFWDGEPIDHYIIVCKELAFLAGWNAAKHHIFDLKQKLDELSGQKLKQLKDDEE